MIFTDLDGTLLDYEGYRWDAAADALRLLAERRVPVVFCSSKTRAEQLVYQNALALQEPFIVENGSAAVVPAGYFGHDLSTLLAELVDPASDKGRPPPLRRHGRYEVIELGLPAREIRRRLRHVRKESGLPFRGYAEMNAAEVSALTGLDLQAARRAMRREYSETIHGALAPDHWRQLRKALAARGLTTAHGRSTCTVISAATDKGRAVSLLAALFRRTLGNVTTVAVGDSENDDPMLRAVNRAFLVERPGGGWAALHVPGLEKVKGIGPAGWSRAIRLALP